MEHRYINSSNLLGVRYQPYTGVLEVAFHNGHVYQYFDVPPQAYRDLMDATSLGRFFNYYIRDHFRFRQIR
jgi:hypothetical protein